MMELLNFGSFSYDILLALLTLTVLEIILGIDNLIFIALVVQRLPKLYRHKARIFGLSLALIIRILMLLTLSWVMSLTKPVFFIGKNGISYKNILLIIGGLFLIVKSAIEIYNDIFANNNLEIENEQVNVSKGLFSAILQISLVDFVFSFDSVITAIGMTNNVPIIVIAVVISMIIMLLASESISMFIKKYPSLKILALAFIFLVGAILLLDGLNIHIAKGYLYFALFFTLIVEILNITSRKKNS